MFVVGGHRGAVNIQFDEYSLIKAIGDGEPVVKYINGEPVPTPDPDPDPIPEPEPDPEPDPDPDPIPDPDPVPDTNQKLLEAITILQTIDVNTLNKQEIRKLHRAIGDLEVMRIY